MAENYCNIHKVQMKKFEKEGRDWYAHKTEDPRFPKGWCHGELKEDKKNGSNTDGVKIRLRLYELALSYAQGDITNWLKDAEAYVFNGNIPVKDPFPQQE